eukprot:s104_g29.t2
MSLSQAQNEVAALHTTTSPLDAVSPYHAFSAAPPCFLRKPCKWPGPEGFPSTLRLLWDDHALYVCWELHGDLAAPVRLKEAPLLEGALKTLSSDQRSLLFDERVECFLWQPRDPQNPGDSSEETYFAFEINYGGKVLTNRAHFGGRFGFDWDASNAFAVWTQEVSVGPEGDCATKALRCRVVIGEFRWEALGLDRRKEIRLGLHRAQHPATTESLGALGAEEAKALLQGMIWTSWIDPDDAEVNFHRAEMFGKLLLQPSGIQQDGSCAAARFLSSKALRILRSPIPRLEECPPGSLLIRAKYASLCGSDFPFFREKRGPASYWDRDGFCGHEAVGVVLDSRSDRFAIGDTVLSLPSSYFKSHASKRADWFDEKVHNEIFTSHELYTYKVKECQPRMLLAQAVATILRALRRVGPVVGKTVVVQGQGQNGLMATRLLSQLCARHIIAVEPLLYRRSVAASGAFGATAATAPGSAAVEAVRAVAPRGADVVLEMVGHNQETINEALDLVKSGGTVVAFGVPDDLVYHFHFEKFFRKNVVLMASVYPDPGVDFPEAVDLLERGQFNTEGIITHTFPLSEIQKAFTMATEYQENVIKDAIIIGAGVIGNSIATELSRSGWRTLNIDKLRGSGQGSTGYSSGICRMMYSLLDSVKFAWEGYDYFEKWEEHIGVKVKNQGPGVSMSQYHT